MYGIGVVKFGDKTVGYIEKGSWDWVEPSPRKWMWTPSRCPVPPC